MRRLLILVAVAAASLAVAVPGARAAGSGACYYGWAGTSVNCGGGYVVPGTPAPTPPPANTPLPSGGAPAPPVTLAWYVVAGPNGPCMVFGPATSGSTASIIMWQQPIQFPLCPPPPATPATPSGAPQPPSAAGLAVHFWRTIPLPVPRPDIPPGYAICGKEAYLVTNGTTTPAPWSEATPLGTLSVKASGSYLVNWGDGSGWSGPYPFEGEPYPDGRITHVYDVAGTYNVTVEESWTATWSLGGAAGTLGGLHTTATIDGFQARQLEPVLNS